MALAGWALIVIGGAVMFAAFPGRYNVAVLPEFLGDYGVAFAVVFGAVQAALVAGLRKGRAVALAGVLFAVGALLGVIGRAVDLHGFCAEHGVSYLEYVLCAGVAVSGLGLGLAIVRGWVYDAD